MLDFYITENRNTMYTLKCVLRWNGSKPIQIVAVNRRTEILFVAHNQYHI